MSLDEFLYNILSKDPDVQDFVNKKAQPLALAEQMAQELAQQKAAQMVEEARVKAETEGEIKGALQALRDVIVNTAEQRFPSLTTLARERVEGVEEPTVLWKVFSSLNAAQDETTARNAITSNKA